jgi:tetraacyldisaccharide 4'-kinase
VAWELAGDEPYLLARRHPRAVVVVGADRVAAGRIAVTELGAEVLVLDDAHQHRRVAQDLAILMVDARRVPWEDHLIPWGRLREPPSAARRAQVSVLLVAEGAATANPADYDRLAALGPAVFTARRRVRAVVAEPSGARYHGDGLPARRVHLFSGIGDPRGFEATVKQLGGEVTGHHIFRDHHRLGRNDLVDLEAQARRAGAELLLTTEKDAVRMEGIASPGGIPVAYLEMELELNAELRVSGAAGHGVRLARAGEAAR